MNIHLMEDSFTEEEFQAALSCFKSGRYTQGKKVVEFEEKFASWNDSKYGVMVNSGSSANLLAVFILKEKYNLSDGDEILVPAVTWPTTIYPVIQNNLTPVFCDVDSSYNISVKSMRKMTTEKTKAVFVVHVLGQSANMDEIIEFCKEKNMLILEDCCESTGAEYKGTKVGNFGIMSTFSFYFVHHMTTIEGGILLTEDPEIQDLLKSARSHGWVRGSSRAEKYKKEYISTDFLFDMLGYNLRSTDLNASLGLVQLERLDSFIDVRRENHRLFKKLIEEKMFKRVALQEVDLDECVSFSFGIVFDSKENRDKILENLPKRGVECRPIIAGNLLQQPVFKIKLKGTFRADICKNSDEIHYKGLYLPNNQFINNEKIEYMINNIQDILMG
ncbi:MAG: DegT/DnrJ/EryC1/StrS family aminotransferase [Promethearchaeota archaeon]|jgi:CDP-6-deoxy-D-xylo-4-hexulose-3-dehydrase